MSQLRDMRADWLMSRTEIHNTDKLVSLALNKHADNEGYCWPSRTLLTIESGLSKRQISRSIQNLRRFGFLNLYKMCKGTCARNFYLLVFPADMVKPNEPGRELPPFRDSKPVREKITRNSGMKGDGMSPVGGQGVSFTGDTVSPAGGQDVLSTGDRRSPSGVTGCPPELIDPELLDPEGFKEKGVKAEGQQGRKCRGDTDVTAGNETERELLPVSGGSAPTPSKAWCGEDQALADKVFELFCRICTALPRVERLSARRARRILRISERAGGENSLDWWRDYFLRISRSPFLTGKSRTGWRASFDWLLNPENAAKVMEGNYDPPHPDYADAEARMLDYVRGMATEMKRDLTDDD